MHLIINTKDVVITVCTEERSSGSTDEEQQYKKYINDKYSITRHQIRNIIIK